jgi:hypothetical protein
VERQDHVRSRVGQDPLRYHLFGTAGLTWGDPLLCRLENEDHGSAQPVLHARQDVGHSQLRRDMGVVAAGVGHSGLTAEVKGSGDGLERQIGKLRHWQPVHIRPDRDHRSGAPAPEDAHDTGVCHSGTHFEAKTRELPRHQIRGAGLPVAHLRIAMDVMPDLDHAGPNPGG